MTIRQRKFCVREFCVLNLVTFGSPKLMVFEIEYWQPKIFSCTTGIVLIA